MALPMQVGAVARNAHFSVDMALAGMTGPVDIIDGQFNYFNLFENGVLDEQLLGRLGKPFKISEVAHKPYPAGRATQTVLTMLRQWREEGAFQVDDIESIDIRIPPLVMLLVGRPREPDMTASYARLCLRFIVPLMLLDGDIDPRRFTETVYNDSEIVRLSEKINILDDGPIANDDTARIQTNQGAINGNVLNNDDDGADDFGTVITAGTYQGNFGTLVINDNGTYTYTRTTGGTGTDTFNYTLEDADGDTDTAQLTVNIVNPPPPPPPPPTWGGDGDGGDGDGGDGGDGSP